MTMAEQKEIPLTMKEKEINENSFHLLTGTPRAGLGSPGYSGIVRGGGGQGSFTATGKNYGDASFDQLSRVYDPSYSPGGYDTTPNFESYADLYSGGR